MPDLETTERELEKLVMGPEMLGQDREFRDYYYTGSDTSGLYVRWSNGNEEVWRYIENRDIESVVSAMHSKGIRERKLKSSIAGLRLLEARWDTQVSDFNKRLQGVRELLLSVESQLATLFQEKGYVWAPHDIVASWHQSIASADSDFTLVSLFRQFVDRATSPSLQLKSGDYRQITALQSEWSDLYEAITGAGSLSFAALTFMGACHVRLKRMRRDSDSDSDDVLEA